MILKKQQGQAMIETIVSSGLTLLSISLLLMMLYRGLIYFTARHCLNEALYCVASLTPITQCQQKFDSQKKKFLLFKEDSHLRIKKNPNEIIASFYIKASGTPDMKLERALRLPLERNL